MIAGSGGSEERGSSDSITVRSQRMTEGRDTIPKLRPVRQPLSHFVGNDQRVDDAG